MGLEIEHILRRAPQALATGKDEIMDMQSHLSEAQIETVKRYRKIEALVPAHWTEDRVLAHGIQQHYYRTGGDKPRLLLLHGFMESALSWLRTAKVLESQYDVIMVDARGHGLSDGIASGYSPQLLTDDVAEFIRALGLDKPAVLGFSLGGEMALRLAALYPDLPRCVLVGGANDQLGDVEAMSSSEGYKAWYNAWVAWLRDLKTQTHEERLVSSLHQLPPGAPLPPEDEYVAMVESSARVDLGLVELGPSLWSLRKAQFEEVKALQERITCPVLLMYSGYFSVPGAPQALREEPSTQPNVKIVRFENAGHMIYRERFDQFIDVVQRFLREH